MTTKATTLAGIIPRGANVLINGDFRINQRVYVSAAALAAGVYGHDRWKAGASGGDYSFVQLASSTQITIASGKSLIQVIEDKNVEGGGYVLSWTGTAQARAGVNSATPSGGYSASPLIISAQTAGTVMSVEFNAGTLGKVKLELGSVPTPFVMSDYVQEYTKCLRYFERLGPGGMIGVGHAISTSSAYIVINFAKKRAVPSLTITNYPSFVVYNATGAGVAWGGWTGPFNTSTVSLLVAPSAMSGLAAGNGVETYENIGNGTIDLSAEL